MQEPVSAEDQAVLDEVINQLQQKARQNNMHARKGFKDFLVEGLTSARAAKKQNDNKGANDPIS